MRIKLILVAMLCVFALPVATHAAVLQSQTDASATYSPMWTTGSTGYYQIQFSPASTVTVSDVLVASNSDCGSMSIVWVFGIIYGSTSATATTDSSGNAACDYHFTGVTLTASTYTFSGGINSSSAGTWHGAAAGSASNTGNGSLGSNSAFTPYATGGERSYMICSTSCSFPAPASGVTITSPTPTTYTGNPVTFAGTYTNQGTYDQIQFYLVSTTTNFNINIGAYALPPVNVINAAWSVDEFLPLQGVYTLKARLYDSTTASSTSYSSTVTFGLGATTTTSTTTQANLPGSPTPIDCGTFDVGCYIKNAFVWLFYPSAVSTDQFSQLTLRNSKPFSYFYDMPVLVDDMKNATQVGTTTIAVSVPWFGHSTTTFTFLSAAKINAVPYASTVRTVIGYLLWLMLAFTIYETIRFVHRKHQK